MKKVSASQGLTDLDLAPPEMFQAPELILDLHDVNPGDPIIISFWLPSDAKSTETVYVNIGDNIRIPFPVSDAALGVQDVPVAAKDLPPLGYAYDVYYTFRGQDSPHISVFFFDSTARFLSSFRHEDSFYGVYPKGKIAAWSVPMMYQLEDGMALIRSVGEKNPSKGPSNLSISRQDSVGHVDVIGTINYAPESNEWSVGMIGDVNFGRGDLVSIVLVDDEPCFLSFSISL